MEDSKLRKVYDTIVKEGYDVPDFATFETDMRDDNKLTQVRDRLVEDGYELPEFGQFKIDMFGAPQEKAWWQTEVGLQKPDSIEYPTNPVEFQAQVDEEERVIAEKLPRANAAMSQRMQRGQTMQGAFERFVAGDTYAKKGTPEYARAQSVQARHDYANMPSEAREKLLEQMGGKEKLSAQFEQMNGRQPQDEMELFEWRTGGYAVRPEFATEKTDANDIAKYNGYSANEINAGMGDEKAVALYTKDILSPQLKAAQEKANAMLKERDAELQGAYYDEYRKNAGIPGYYPDDTSWGGKGRAMDKDWQMLKAAENINRETEQLVDAAVNDRNGWTAFGRTLANIDTWFPVMSGLELSALMELKDVDPEKASPAQKALMEALALRASAEASYAGDISNWYKMGEGVANMVPLWFEMAFNPLSGVGKAAAKKVAKGVMKSQTKKALAESGKAAMKQWQRRVLAKGAGFLGSLAGGAGMASTTSLPKVAVGAGLNSMGQAQYDINAGGIELDSMMPGGSYWSEFGKEFARTAIEHGTEQMGAEWLGKALGKPLKWAGKGVSKIPGVGKGVTRTTQFLEDLGGEKYELLKNLAKDVKYDGPLEEFGEEFMSALLTRPIDDDSLKKFFEKDNLLVTLGTVVAPFGVGATMAGGYNALKGNYKAGARERNKQLAANARAAGSFGENQEEWKNIKYNLNNADTFVEMQRVYNSPDYTNEQKKNALEYAVHTLRYMAATGSQVDLDENTQMLNGMLRESYGWAYENTAPEAVNGNMVVAADKALRDAESAAKTALGLQSDTSIEDFIGNRSVDEVAMGDDAVAEALRAYYAEKALFEGMQDKMQDTRENEYLEADKSVDAVAHKVDGVYSGNIYRATLSNTGEEIFITGGKVVLDSEGYIDVNQSEGLVALINGEHKAIKVGDVRGKVTVENAEAQKAAKRAEIDARYKSQLNTFTYTDKADGAQHTIQLVSRGDDMARVVLDGVEQDVPNNVFDEIVAETTAEASGKLKGESGEQEAENEVEPVPEGVNAGKAESGNVVSPVETTQPELTPKQKREEVAKRIPMKGKERAWTEAEPADVVEYISLLTNDPAKQQAAVDKFIADIKAKQEKVDAITALEMDEDIAFWEGVKQMLAEKATPVAEVAAVESAPVAEETQPTAGVAAEAQPIEQVAEVAPVQEESGSPEIPNSSTGEVVSPVVKTESGEVKTENAVSEAEAPGRSGVAEIKEPTFTEEVLENGDKRITKYNSRGEVEAVSTERDGKIVSVDSYDEGVLFETTTYDENGVATSVTRYDKSGNVVAKQEFEKSGKPNVNTHSVIKSEFEKKALRERAAKWAKKLGVKVHVLESYDEVIDEEALENILKGRTPGWFAGGEVYLYMPHLIDEADLDRTVVHESVAHKGIRQMLGEEFGKFLDNVWNSMSVPAKAKFLSYVKAKKNATQADRRAAADEYVASIAEKVYKEQGLTAEEKNIWQKFVAWFKKKFNADEAKAEVMSKDVLDEKDIAKMVLASYSKLTESGEVKGENDGDFRARKNNEGTRFSKEELGDIEELNDRFNRELQQQIDGTLPKTHMYQLGMPSSKLLAAEIDNLPIELPAWNLLVKSKKDYKSQHPYNLSDVKDLVRSVHNPIAVFDSEEQNGKKVILTELKDKKDRNFIAVLDIRRRGGRNYVEINSVISLYPKDSAIRIAKWFDSEKAGLTAKGEALLKWADKNKTLIWLSSHSSDVNAAGLSYKRIANIVSKFEKTNTENKKSASDGTKFRKVTPEMDAEYMGAVENGDMETAERLVKEAAKRAMPDTKVVDENGFPKVVYHRTPNEFTIFDPEKIGASTDAGAFGSGFYLSPADFGPLYGKNLMPLFVNLKNPLMLNDANAFETKEPFYGEDYSWGKEQAENFNAWVKENGYDGVWYENNGRDEIVAFEPNQIKSADAVTYDDNGNVIPLSERFNEEKEDIRFRKANENQEIFVSNARKAVEEIKQEKATPEQWLAMIKKNGGLKAGEDKWMGLSEWLEEKGKLKGENGKTDPSAAGGSSPKTGAQSTVTKQEILDFIGENKIQIEEVNYTQFGYGLIDEATRKLEAELKEIGWDAMVEKYPGFDELFEVYDGELLWSEERASVGEYEDFIIDNKIVDLDSQSNAINETREKYTTEGLENKREIALVVPTVEPYNVSDEIHFGDAGGGRAVAWVRFGETTDSEGNRVLVIDEIQSKRHQDGREKGYKSQADKTPATMDELSFGDLVPDAPFEKNWQELAMKRMLRLAAEEGFDKVAWTTGEQQAERYNIAKVVSHIECEKVGKNGNKSFSMGLDYKFIVDPNGIVVSSKDEYIGKSIADIVGKPLANKMLEMQEGDTISGDGLRIGGEGMKGFYDRMLPSFVSKYTKKWGAKVGSIEMPSLEQNNVMHSVDVTPEMRESVMEGQTMFRRGDWNERVDRDGNRIGDGSSHMRYKVDEVALSYPNISYKVDESATTESVYVTYYNNDPKYSENERPKVTVRYSTHDSNAVKFGDQLRGEAVERNNGELLYRLGLKEREWIPAPSVPTQTVSKKDLENNTYEESELTERDIMLLPVGADIAEHKGKLIKGTNKLILVDKVLANNNRGYYRYSDIPEVEQQRAKQLVREIVEPFAKEKREEVEKQRPFHEMIDDLYNNENVDKSKYGMTYFHVAETPDFMASIGLSGAEFTIPFKAISTHIGKDSDHYLDADIWHSLPEALQNPFLVTKYGKDDRFRIYTTLMHDGKYVAVGVDVKRINQGRNKPIIEINSIKTVFAKTGKIGENETVVCYDERITPEQEALLNGRNFRQYPTIQELSVDKDSTSSAEMQEERTLFSKELTPEQKKKQEDLKENAKKIRQLHNAKANASLTALRNLRYVLETDEERALHDELFAQRDAIIGEGKKAIEMEAPKGMTLKERITESLLKLAGDNNANVDARLAAIRALNNDMANVLKLMRVQKEYDRNTVAMFTGLVKQYLRNNAMKGMSSYDIMRLLVLMQRATGGYRLPVYRVAVKIADIITKEHTRQLEEMMRRQMKTGAEKVNASGVVVQGGVDIVGKRVLNAYQKAIEGNDAAKFEEDFANAVNRVVAEEKMLDEMQKAGKDTKSVEKRLQELRAELDAMTIARVYREEVAANKDDIEKLIGELRDKRAELDKGNITRREYNEFADKVNELIVTLRAQQIDAYQKVVHALGGDISEGMKRAKEFREAEVARVQRIHDMAESDMNGVSKSAEREKRGIAGKTVDMVIYKNPLVRTIMSGTGTYEQYMKYFGRDHLDGRGALFEHFMTAFHEAHDKQWRESQNDFNMLDAQSKQIFGKDYKKIARESTKPSGVILEYWNGGKKVSRELTIGQLMYIYMTEKQTEGAMKLRNMGLTEEIVANAVAQLPAKYKQFADYIQAEFLPMMRPRINEVHQRMFGASMSEVENYFPLVVNKDARSGNYDLNNATDILPSTVTGSIIKRRVNVTPLNLEANAFDVLNNHIVDMEHWAAYAEFTRDNNTLLSDKDFMNRVKNTSSVRYGNGETLWDDFVETARIATDSYRRRNNVITKLMRGANAAKITFGYFTALKQLASMPAFWSDAKIWDAVWYAANPMGSWKWAIDNLPGFEERWKGRTGGNERLEENEYSIHDSRIMKAARMVGLTPNAFIDAIVVASGARAVYKDKLRFYKAVGMTEYEADKRAKRDAAISYNETQQSGQGAYLSTLQKSGGLDTLLLTLFRNSQMAFQRRVVGSIADIGKKLARGEKVREATKQKYVEMGMSEEAADKKAFNDFCKAYAKDITNLVIFGYGMNYVWYLMGELPYLLLGDDEEEKEKIMDGAAKMGFTGMFEGLALGGYAKGLYERGVSGSKYGVDMLVAPFETDLELVLDRFEKDGTMAGVLQLANFAIEMNSGISPQRLIDNVAAIIDFSNGDIKTATDAQLLALRLMKVPQSQIDKLILDETHGASAEEVQDIAERYIEYKMNRNFPFGSEDEKRVDKYANKFVETLKERVEKEYAPEDISVIFDKSSDTEKEILKKKWIEGMDERNGTNVAKSLRKEKIGELLGLPIEKAAQKALHGITKKTPYEYLETFEDLQEFYEIKSKQKELEPLFEAYKEELKTLNENEQLALFQKNEKMVRLYNLLKRKEQVIFNNKKLMKNNPEMADEYMNNIRRLRAEAIDLINNYNE